MFAASSIEWESRGFFFGTLKDCTCGFVGWPVSHCGSCVFDALLAETASALTLKNGF